MRPRFSNSWILIFAFSLGLTPVVSVRAQIEDLSVNQLVAQLDDDDLEMRRDAIYELVKRGVTDAPVITAMASLTDDRDDQIQFQALMGLARAGEHAFAATDALIDRLDDYEDQVRYRASVALGNIGEKALPKLLKAWDQGSSRKQAEIARAIARMGPSAARAREKLLEGLENGNENVRRFSAEAIHAIAPKSEDTLLHLAAQEDETVRRVGIAALASLPDPSPAVAKRLKDALTDQNAQIRETAILALGKSALPQDEKAAYILDALKDSELAVREAAVVTIEQAGLLTEEFARQLAGLLNPSLEPEVSMGVLKSLAVLGREASSVLPKLVEFATGRIDQITADDKEFHLLVESMAALGAEKADHLLEAIDARPILKPVISEALALIGPEMRDSLIAALASKQVAVRETAVQAIGATRPLDFSLINHLLTATHDSEPQVRKAAVEAIVEAGQTEDIQVPLDQLGRALKDADSTVRAAAITSLAVFDYPEDVVRSSLASALEDSDPTLRLAALNTIDAIRDDVITFLDSVITLASDDSESVRAQALRTLRHLDSDNIEPRVEEAIVAGLRDEADTIRAIATGTVASLELASEEVLAALSDNLGPDAELLRATLEAIGKAGTKASPLIPAVSQLIEHEDEAVRKTAVNTYAKIEANESTLTGRMTDALDDQSWTVRQAAAEQLANIGPAAKSAVPKLFKLLSSDDDSDSASNAIREIDAAPSEAIPLFMDNLDSEDRRTGFYAIFLLGKVGPAASEALPKLEAMLKKIEEDGGSEFRTRFLRQSIASIKGEESQDNDD